MPKENTHLWFADQVLRNSKDNKIEKIISDNVEYYNLGSIAPDIFWYLKNSKIVEISKWIHGKKGNLTNEPIFQMLEKAKSDKDERYFAFICGYITHCALDIIFHPVVIYLTGNIFSNDEREKVEAEFNHRFWETYLDKIVNNQFDYPKLIEREKMSDVDFFNILSSRFKVAKDALSDSFSRQYGILKKIRSKFIFRIISILNKLGLFSRKNLAIFYLAIKKEETLIPDKIEYLDLFTGEKKKTTIKNLFAEATAVANKRIAAAFDFLQENIDRDQAEEIIRGESLETGKEGMAASRIKYFIS